MKITFLGQAGFLIKITDGPVVMIDPYLSNTLQEQKGNQFKRLIPIREEMKQMKPDILLFTHDHGDHYDPESVKGFLDGPPITVFAPYPVSKSVKKQWPGKHNVVVMRASVEYSLLHLHIKAITAFHETIDCVGYVLRYKGKSMYFSGDTLYSKKIVACLAGEVIDVAFVCINGFGNNMNVLDAERLVETLNPKLAVPVHWDMFKSFGADPKTFCPHIPHRIVQANESIEI